MIKVSCGIEAAAWVELGVSLDVALVFVAVNGSVLMRCSMEFSKMLPVFQVLADVVPMMRRLIDHTPVHCTLRTLIA